MRVVDAMARRIAVALLVLLAGCDLRVANISTFAVAPARACRFPVTANAHWAATGNTATLQLPGDRPFSVPVSTPAQPFTMPAPGDVVLTVQGYGTQVQIRSIAQQTDDITAIIGGAAACAGSAYLAATVTLPPVPEGMVLQPITLTVPAGRAGAFLAVDSPGHVRLVIPALPGECSLHPTSGGPTPPPRIEALARWTCPGADSPHMPGPGAPGTNPGQPPGPACGTEGAACCIVNGHPACRGDGLDCQIGANVCLSRNQPPRSVPRCNGQPVSTQSQLRAGAVIDANGCGAPWSYLADSDDEANGCALRDAPGATIAKAPLTRFDICRTPGDDPKHPIENSYVSDSAENALRCATHQFVKANPGTTLAAGHCPPPPDMPPPVFAAQAHGLALPKGHPSCMRGSSRPAESPACCIRM
jgi:hypothetical protein